jgi:ribose 5-phosphate isomerase A
MVVGLGSGRAATAFIHALGERVSQGMKVRGVPTSEASASVARQHGIPLMSLSDVEMIDLTVDGADEVDPQGNCIKGYGGALVREKIVAASSKQLVIVVGKEKLVSQLGERGKLPVEVLPFGQALCERRIGALGWSTQLRRHNGQPLVTDNGNFILDVAVGPLDHLTQVDHSLLEIPGLIGTGLFLGIANAILIEHDGKVEVRRLR